MASFHGPRFGEDLSERYARIEGNDVDHEAVKAWTTFVRALQRGQPPDWRSAFSAFVLAVQPLQRAAAQPRVFVSHRQKDGPIAEQIAWQATEAAKDYWLDLHDGTLKLANNTLSQTDPRYALIIAGIIEMALLSCTHVIATHTQNSLGSKWIPYELARAKSRQVISSQAAGWFAGSILKPEWASMWCWPRSGAGGRRSMAGSERRGHRVSRRNRISARPTRRVSSSTSRRLSYSAAIFAPAKAGFDLRELDSRDMRREPWSDQGQSGHSDIQRPFMPIVIPDKFLASAMQPEAFHAGPNHANNP
jgi:hypothetical protein